MPDDVSLSAQVHQHLVCPYCKGPTLLMSGVLFDVATMIVYCDKCKVVGIAGDTEFFNIRNSSKGELLKALKGRLTKS